jgi:hypothetical protein
MREFIDGGRKLHGSLFSAPLRLLHTHKKKKKKNQKTKKPKNQKTKKPKNQKKKKKKVQVYILGNAGKALEGKSVPVDFEQSEV